MNLVVQLLGRALPLADSEAFARFYENTHLKTFQYVMALNGGQENRAEDITAEAYLRAWKNRHQFSGSSDAALGWILVIARHIIIDQYRTHTTRPLEVELDDEVADDAVDVEFCVVTQELTERAIAALQYLPERPREMVALRYVLGWQVNQIARHMEVPENTVSVTIRRALGRLRGYLLSQGVPHE